MTIKRKMILLISSILMFIVLLSIVFIYNESSNILKDEAEKYMAAQLDRANENIGLLLKTIVLETEKLSAEDQVVGYFNGRLAQTLSDTYLTDLMAEKNRVQPLYFDLFLMDHDGIIVSAAMAEAIGVDVGSRIYFQKALNEGLTNTSDIILSRADKTQIVITISPVENPEGVTIGYAGMAIYATYFSGFLNGFDVNDASEYIIVDSFDHIVSHPNKKKISSKFNYFGLDKQRIVEENTIAYKGETYRILKKDLGFNNWKIFSYLKYDDINAKSMELSYSFMRIAIIAVFIAIGVGIYLTDLIARPIITMTESINKMIEDEDAFQHQLVDQLPIESVNNSVAKGSLGMESTEVSNFKKAVLGFKTALMQGAENFEVEHTKLRHYIDGLSKELAHINKRNLEFIATLSHDIRTPLTLIKGYARGLESGEITDGSMQEKFQSGIVKSAEDIEHLIYNVLDFVYEANHPAVYAFKAYTYDTLLQEILFELKTLYAVENHRIHYVVEKEGYEKRCVNLDLMNIKRLLVNLVNNSIKYTKDGDLIQVSLLGHEEGVQVTIYDEGLGIAVEEQEQIFDMFYRTEASKDVKGYGLGLYISQQILNAHGSRLTCQSAVGQWTKMTFWLPWYTDFKSIES